MIYLPDVNRDDRSKIAVALALKAGMYMLAALRSSEGAPNIAGRVYMPL